MTYKILTGPHPTNLGGDTYKYESRGGKSKVKKRRSLKKRRMTRKKKCEWFPFF